MTDASASTASAPAEPERWAPEATLLQSRGPELKRFRRLHRLAHPTVLFVGPYDAGGGLELALDLAYDVRGRFEDLRLAAVPLGAVDRRYLDRCEARALGLGHRAIIEWTVDESDKPFWYATASVVVAPWLVDGPPEPARLAALAARPFVGSDLPSFRATASTDGSILVAPGDAGALRREVERLLADRDEANRLGELARAAAAA